MEPTLTQAKLRKEPNPQEMKAFAASFKPAQWSKLCENKEFLEAVATDLVLAKKIADSRLST